MQLQEDVVKILKAVLNLKENSISFETSAQLLGGLPEFDSWKKAEKLLCKSFIVYGVTLTINAQAISS